MRRLHVRSLLEVAKLGEPVERRGGAGDAVGDAVSDLPGAQPVWFCEAGQGQDRALPRPQAGKSVNANPYLP